MLQLTIDSVCWALLLLTITVLGFTTIFTDIQQTKRPISHYALLSFSVIGGLLMLSFGHLITLFLGIEILSIPLYVLIASHPTPRSQEAGLKYFLLGAFSTAFLLFGAALIYAKTGQLYIDQISAAIPSKLDPPLMVGITLFISGLLFKIGAAPFHAWVPDAYDGAPTRITTFMSTIVKIAAVVALLKVAAIFNLLGHWQIVWAALGLLSLAVGSILALRQTNLKRLLAYSSIAHAGYMLLAFPLQHMASHTLFVYLATYSLASLVAFGILHIIETQEELITSSTLNGLWTRSPFLGAAWLISILSLAGIPPLPGFFAKYLLLICLIQTGHTAVAIAAILFALIGLSYYFPLLTPLFSKPDSTDPISFSWTQKLGIGLTVGILILLMVWPALVL